MKKLNLIFLILLIVNFKSKSQSAQDVFTATEITWYGLDFSQAKFIGPVTNFNDAGGKNGNQLRDIYFPAWNNLLIKEGEKYNFKDAYRKPSVPYDLTISDKRNAEVNPDEILSKTSNQNKLSTETINQIAEAYKTGKSGIGLIYIIGDFDKIREEAIIYETFFNTSSGAVLWSKERIGKPGGFGIKNYWAGAIYSAIQQSKKDYKNAEKGK